MNDYSTIAKLLENMGTTGLIIWTIWKLVDRWAGKFLDVQTKQATAMGDLAAAVRESTGEQKELLLAMRVQSTKLDEVKGWMRDLDEHIRKGSCKFV